MAPVQSLPVVREATSEAGQRLPTWFWPVLTVSGVAVTAGLLYWWLNPSPSPSPSQTKSQRSAARPEKPGADGAEDPEEELPQDPFERAVSLKNKGNKYFKGGRYELAIKCYNEAIDENWDAVFNDCTRALELNKRYLKAMDRRAKVLRKQVRKLQSADGESVNKLRMALEDMTAVCILDGFQKQEYLMLVDTILKELGRVEAKIAIRDRQPGFTSHHFIQQYFQSFAEDPIVKLLAKNTESDSDDSPEDRDNATGNIFCSGFMRALKDLKDEMYEQVIDHCTEEIDQSGAHVNEAKLLRGTFFILSKQPNEAFQDFNQVIEDSEADVSLRVNALIKRASLYIQQCKDPMKDPELSFADFKQGQDLDETNADIYHHRGQVHLLIDQTPKALEDFNKAVELNPGFPIAYVQKLYTEYRIASTSDNKSEIPKLIQQFQDAMEKFPKCVETYALFAQVLSDQSQFDRAEDVYQQAQKVDPKNANILVHRGLIALQAKGDIEGAVSLIKKALEVDDKCEFGYETLGTIEVQRGKLKEAIELFDKAIPIANTELEMAHLFGLKHAANAQTTVSKRFGISLPSPMGE
eukprot:TCALIF_12222-PA protein Name:"Similar to TOMM70A Mitochondrial import receptor subunit TOM70 (Homo sapiens)" AED:0.21 eAED:0.21 QI:0/0.4/0.5/0.83/1/1/6/169/580